MIADPEQLGRVIHNIIGNAIKYMRAEEPSFISMRIKDVGDFIQVEIEDNGKGISNKDRHIFLTAFTGQMLRAILRQAEAVSDFPLSKRSLRIMVEKSGQPAKRM